MTPPPSLRRDAPPRDPVTGTPADGRAEHRDKAIGQKSSDELADDIRRTRAEMSETVDALERRLSPERLKSEAKHTVHETIDEVRDRFNPQHAVERTGRHMLDAVQDHPLPALVAGASLAYLFMKAGEKSARNDEYDYDYGRRSAYSRRPYSARGRYYPDARYAGSYERTEYGYADGYSNAGYDDRDEDASRSRSAEDSASMRERISEKADDVQEHMSHLSDQVQDRAESLSRTARHRSRRAQSGLESFVMDNPLAAGAIAAGVGALLGGLLPSSEPEDQWMGSARDEVVHRAKEAAEETMERAEQVAGRVADEAKDAAQQIKKSAAAEAQSVKEEAKQGAAEVAEKAKQQAREKASDDPAVPARSSGDTTSSESRSKASGESQKESSA